MSFVYLYLKILHAPAFSFKRINFYQCACSVELLPLNGMVKMFENFLQKFRWTLFVFILLIVYKGAIFFNARIHWLGLTFARNKIKTKLIRKLNFSTSCICVQF
jgi:hypothetical protein